MWIGKLGLIYSFTFSLSIREMILEWGNNYRQKHDVNEKLIPPLVLVLVFDTIKAIEVQQML